MLFANKFPAIQICKQQTSQCLCRVGLPPCTMVETDSGVRTICDPQRCVSCFDGLDFEDMCENFMNVSCLPISMSVHFKARNARIGNTMLMNWQRLITAFTTLESSCRFGESKNIAETKTIVQKYWWNVPSSLHIDHRIISILSVCCYIIYMFPKRKITAWKFRSAI